MEVKVKETVARYATGILMALIAIAGLYLTPDGIVFRVLIGFATVMMLLECYSIRRTKVSRLLAIGPQAMLMTASGFYNLAESPFSLWFAAGGMLYLMSSTPDKIIAILLIACLNDTFAWFFGRKLGRKLVDGRFFWEKISPNKTLEGYVFGAFAACSITWFFVAYMMTDSHTAPETVYFTLLCVLGPLFGDFGDLVGSAFKRLYFVKNSNEAILESKPGKILELPLTGHGGYLDRFGSISAVACLALMLEIVLELARIA